MAAARARTWVGEDPINDIKECRYRAIPLRRTLKASARSGDCVSMALLFSDRRQIQAHRFTRRASVGCAPFNART